MNDSLKPFVPQYYGTVRDDAEDGELINSVMVKHVPN